ncbi:AraC family transcriptional regulator [Pararhizobium antarcticum]|uniref:AraC family transcriptional regulator n=1 Tax=Pararhizobium antarcticum TaxID=1798805 RepID=A0A657LP42_9HYPH|nr:AraC family transcriptional regulator [Pararhizobium antarcticum]OJF92258.1 AraC family transcriptional regulator [Pararhizobium antarcticum]OJF94860.1 AraC family transcriptional regulator [Rhizobium sp. 58]
MTEERQSRQQELIDLIARFAKTDGDHTTAIQGLNLYRRSTLDMPACGAYRPSLALIAQGTKQVTLAEETYRYSGSDYLLTALDLPVITRIVEASPERPYLSMSFQIDTGRLPNLIAQTGVTGPLPGPAARGMAVSPVTTDLRDAAIRMLRLLDRPHDIPALLSLIEQELVYRLLTGPQGARLRQMAIAESQSHQVSRACSWLRDHYALPLRIEELANRVSMSVSSLHHHFKAITAMSPMQYQKQLRLQEARRLMLEDMLDAGSAGHRVGYESQSQFSREYTRQFGAPPLRDVGRIRQSLVGRLTGGTEMMSEG